MTEHYLGQALHSDVPPVERLVLIYLGADSDDEGAVAPFDPTSFAADHHLSEALVADAIASLHALRLIHYDPGQGVLVSPGDLDGAECRQYLWRAQGRWGVHRQPNPRKRLAPKAALKARALIAFALTCVYCHRVGIPERGPDGRPWELDRVVPGASGGEYEAGNVVLACRTCNRDKGARLNWDIDTVTLEAKEGIPLEAVQ